MRMVPFVIRNSSCVLAVSLVLLMAWGCRKKSGVPTPAPPQITAAAPANPAPAAVTPSESPLPETALLEPAPLPKTVAAPSSLDLGEMDFQKGNYRQAARSLEAFLSANPNSKDRDQALFHLGLSRTLANDSSRDLRQAEAAFRRLIAEFPDSPYRNQVELILGLQAQIERLKSDVRERDERIKRLGEELQKLKEIDMQRRPSRPPE
jgi:tetratricopeptide (TPR) repeat protein